MKIIIKGNEKKVKSFFNQAKNTSGIEVEIVAEVETNEVEIVAEVETKGKGKGKK